MKKINVLSMVLGLAAINGSHASFKHLLEIKSNKIVGGVESDIKKHPYMISLQRTSGSHFCGGSLIAPNFVLTAGHCMITTADKLKVVIGSQNSSSTASTAEVHKVKKITRHPLYNSSTVSHDFSLLELDTESAQTPVPLIEALEDPANLTADGSSITMGWGTTSEGGSLARTLMEVKIPLVSREVCNEPSAYNGDIDETMICAGLKEGGKDSCQGDSGGPLVVTDAEGNEVLVGVVSWGEGCARPNKYGVYSNVAFAREWIDENMGLNPEFLTAN